MPTRGRVKLAAEAVRCFAEQDYAEKELIILDDLNDRSFPSGSQYLAGMGIRVLYFLHASRCIAEKRNLCADLTRGEILFHTDSDDWSHPGRMSSQVKLLEESGKAAVGYHSMLFHVEPEGPALKYMNPDPGYAIGTSLCYTKEFWRSHAFRTPADTPTYGEDNMFVAAAHKANELISVDAGQFMVARIHPDNTAHKDISKYEYRRVDRAAIPEAFFR